MTGADLAEIRRAVALLFAPGDVVELRAVDVRGKIHAGYFTDFEKLAREAAKLSGAASGVYVVLNRINPDLLARSANRIIVSPKNLTQDNDVVRRLWLPIDIDSKRPAGISATDAEHQAALNTAKAVEACLIGLGFPADSIIVGDSGNGAHVLARADLSNDLENRALIESCLKALAVKFDSDRVAIDQTVHNAARIWKLPGTLARKGDSTVERPHRIARIITAPERLTTAPMEAFESLAATLQTEEPKAVAPWRPFNLQSWLQEHGIEVSRVEPYKGGTRHILKQCPFNPEHRGTSVAVFEGPDGLGFKCHHNACHGKTWGDVRELFEPGYKRPGRKPEPDEKAHQTFASFIVAENYLYEEIYRDGKSAFIEYNINTSDTRIVSHIKQGDMEIHPQYGEEIEMGAVKLPSGIVKYGDTMSLLNEIMAHGQCYLDVSKAFLKFAAYYILLSWLYDRFDTLPYLRFLGDTGTGKSRGLDVIGGLCYRSTIVSGCITPAPIYRMLKRWTGTMVLDEADLKNSDEYNEVVTILNCGFEKGRPVSRATKDNPDKLQFFPVYGPKVFATRRRFKDAALESRCLTEIMSETARDDIAPTLTSEFYGEQEALRNKLLLFRFRNYNSVSPDQVTTLQFKDIEPRLKQISTCFCCLFAGQPDALEDFLLFIRNQQRELIEQRAATPVGQVVEQLFSLIDTDTLETIETLDTGGKLLKLSAGDIADKLNSMDARVVGQILKNLGLRTRAVKVSGSVKRCIVFEENKLNVLRRRYIQSEDDSVSKVSKVSKVKGLREESVKNGVEV